MKISELLNEDSDHYMFATEKQPQKPRREGPVKKLNTNDPNYTPGKAALEQEYEETEEHTKTHIPHKQAELNDPRK